MGCLGLMFMLLIVVWIYSYYELYGGFRTTFMFAILPITVIYLIVKYFVKYKESKEKKMKDKLRDPQTSEVEKEEIRRIFEQKRMIEMEEEKQNNAISIASRVRYTGGHERYIQSRTGGIYLYDNEIRFYSSYSTELFFSIPISSITNVKHDTSEELSTDKFIIFGIASLAMKDKYYYLIIEYIGDSGVANQVVFETGKDKRQNFVNQVNVVRNRTSQRTDRRTTTSLGKDSSIDSIRQLAELKEKGILTEEEFTEKKKQILNRM